MLCKICSYDIKESCQYFYQKYNTNLLCIFKHIPNEIIRHILEFLHHYNGHIISYYESIYSFNTHNMKYFRQEDYLCTSCFQLGLHKKNRDTKHIYRIGYNKQFFNSWMDDDYMEQIQNEFIKQFIPNYLLLDY